MRSARSETTDRDVTVSKRQVGGDEGRTRTGGKNDQATRPAPAARPPRRRLHRSAVGVWAARAVLSMQIWNLGCATLALLCLPQAHLWLNRRKALSVSLSSSHIHTCHLHSAHTHTRFATESQGDKTHKHKTAIMALRARHALPPSSLVIHPMHKRWHRLRKFRAYCANTEALPSSYAVNPAVLR